jgi:hypothetical protein
MLPLVTQTDCPDVMWFVHWILILTGLSSYIILTFDPFMSANLSKCSELS